MFIGIEGISTSSDPKHLDRSRNIVISNCNGTECGHDKSDVSYCPTVPNMPMTYRGAFIAFQAQYFLGPTQAIPFYCGTYNTATGEADNTAEYPKCFQGITIENCSASSLVAQAGIFLNYTNSCTIRNCTMQLNANFTSPLPASELVDAYAVNVRPISRLLQSLSAHRGFHRARWLRHLLLSA